MKHEADVSVIIACRNASSTLGEALRSVLGQTVRVREILVGDDASTDDIASVIDLHRGHGIPIRLIRSERNIGPASMRNLLLQQCAGEWVSIFDGDDSMKPRRLETLLGISEGCDAVSDDLVLWMDGVRESGSVCESHKFRRDGTSLVELSDMIRFDLGLLKPLLRRSFLESRGLAYTEGMFHTEDLDLYVRFLLAGARWNHSPEKLYLYRKHPQSLSKNWREGLNRSYEALEVLQGYPGIAGDPELQKALERRKQLKRDLETIYTIRDGFHAGDFFRCLLRCAMPKAWAASYRLARNGV
jgi:glycosyltransferase involved in cell wall biosynthesis